MRRCVFVLLVWSATNMPLLCALALPKWTDEERVLLEKGQLIPGASLLVESDDASPLPKATAGPEEKLPEPAKPESIYDPKTIPSEYLTEYFQSYPKTYVIDPQRLLTMQETQDREGFLDYHAEDSEIDIRLYLFDAQQQIPAPYTFRKLVSERYAESSLTAVVFCFVGDPSRTMLAFGGHGAEHVTQQDTQRILDSARIKSLETSDPSAQVEAFIVQLSIRLYWLEKSLKSEQIAAVPPAPSHASPSKPNDRAADRGFFNRYKPFLLYLVVGASGILISLTAVAMACFLWRKNKKYRFPVIEFPRRLGADYGAGVGAVLGFRDSFGSPSSQRDQVPDYLLRP